MAVLADRMFLIEQRLALVESAIKSPARLLLHDGGVDEQALRDKRVTGEEVRPAIRKAGIGNIATIAAVLIETDSSYSVIPFDKVADRSAMPGGRQGHRQA